MIAALPIAPRLDILERANNRVFHAVNKWAETGIAAVIVRKLMRYHSGISETVMVANSGRPIAKTRVVPNPAAIALISESSLG